MDEALKNRIILILGILCAILLIVTIGSCSNAYRQKTARDKEMAARLDIEEKMSKFSHDKSSTDEKLKAVDQGLQDELAAHQATKKALMQEQLINQSLKDELDKVTKLKETLEENLAASKSKIKK